MTGSAFIITPEEMEALSGLGPVATTLYVWLRSWMDFDTGLVGFTNRISLGKLETYCETETPKGSGAMMVKPSRDQVRRVLERLKRAGLLARLDTELLVFKLPLATIGNPRPKRTRHETATHTHREPATAKHAQLSDEKPYKRGEPAAGYETEPATHQRSDISFSEDKKSNHQSVSVENARETADFDFAALPDDWVHTTPVGWVNQFNTEFGCSIDAASDRFWRGDLLVLEGWVAKQVELGRVRSIVARAKASAGSRINNILLYVNACLSRETATMGRNPATPGASAQKELPPFDVENGKRRIAGLKHITKSLKRIKRGGKHG